MSGRCNTCAVRWQRTTSHRPASVISTGIQLSAGRASMPRYMQLVRFVTVWTKLSKARFVTPSAPSALPGTTLDQAALCPALSAAGQSLTASVFSTMCPLAPRTLSMSIVMSLKELLSWISVSPNPTFYLMHTATDSVYYPDVHHANGTEETVRYLRPVLEARDTLDPRSFGTLYSPVYKPWHDQTDSSNVFLVSVHGFGTRERGLEYLLPRAAFYPGTGKTVYPSYSSLERPAQSSDEFSAPVPVQSRVSDSAAEESDGDGDENEPNDDRNGDEDEDDDSEDDDDSFNPNGEADDASSEEEQELGVQERATVQALKRIYGSYSMLRDSNKPRADGAPGDMSAPLILDVGIGLPEPDIDDGGLSYRYSWRNYWRNEIFPRLLRFQPDLILVSAGFDAHKKVSSMCLN